MVLLPWAKQQVWWPLVREILAVGGQMRLVVPSIPPGMVGVLRNTATGGMVTFVVDEDCPEWVITLAAPTAALAWLTSVHTPAAPPLPYFVRGSAVGEA